MNYGERISKATDLMDIEGFDILVLSRPTESRSLYYLTGVDRLCANLILHKNGRTTLLILEQDLLGADKIDYLDEVLTFNSAKSQFKAILSAIEKKGSKTGIVGVEKSFIHQNFFESLRAVLPLTFQIKDAVNITGQLRLVKTEDEIQIIKKASAIATQTMDKVAEMVEPGIKQNEIAATAEHEMRLNGAEETATRTFVASGSGTQADHSPASNRQIENGDLVLVDIHPRFKGYSSDLATTFATPGVKTNLLKAMKSVLESKNAAIEEVKVGDKLSSIHENYIERIKKSELIFPRVPFFNNIHGIGVSANDPPSFWYPIDIDLKAGNVLAYVQSPCLIPQPNLLGVRFEDTYLITKTDIERLTHFEHRI